MSTDIKASMDITVDAVRDLRLRTGAGIMDCKAALQEAGGNVEQAVKILREKGKIKAAKKADRVAAEGVIGVYVHSTKKVAGMVSLRCETDFVARNERFQELARDLAIHVVATNPDVVRIEDMPEAVIAEERAVFFKEVEGMGKTGDMAATIVEGKLQKSLAERSLLSQPFVKNPDITVGELLTDRVSELGENIVIERFVRMVL